MHGNTGDIYDYEVRIHDARLGMFLSVDPKSRKYTSWSPYQFAHDSPIRYSDNGYGPPASEQHSLGGTSSLSGSLGTGAGNNNPNPYGAPEWKGDLPNAAGSAVPYTSTVCLQKMRQEGSWSTTNSTNTERQSVYWLAASDPDCCYDEGRGTGGQYIMVYEHVEGVEDVYHKPLYGWEPDPTTSTRGTWENEFCYDGTPGGIMLMADFYGQTEMNEQFHDESYPEYSNWVAGGNVFSTDLVGAANAQAEISTWFGNEQASVAYYGQNTFSGVNTASPILLQPVSIYNLSSGCPSGTSIWISISYTMTLKKQIEVKPGAHPNKNNTKPYKYSL